MKNFELDIKPAALLIFAGMAGLTGFMNSDPEVISMFNGFIIGTAIGGVAILGWLRLYACAYSALSAFAL